MRVLFVLSQRPELTGSGITLDALVRHAKAAGHEPWVLCGVPAGEPVPDVGGIGADRIFTVTFGAGGDLPFPVPGMSDVMPYRSTVWSEMSAVQLQAYGEVWRERLDDVLTRVGPDLVHANHLWVVSALLPELLQDLPSVAHCHATGLRQMQLCPSLRAEVVEGLRGLSAFAVLHEEHAHLVVEELRVPEARVHVVGAGYREDLFHLPTASGGGDRRGNLLYVGKFASAKGLPWLLDSCERLWSGGAQFTLHVAGDGSGEEAEGLRARMEALSGQVVLHGRLDQAELGALMRRCASLVLPSFYEGLPLVLAEARACGCNLVSTALSGVRRELAPAFGDALQLVELPRLMGPDQPDPRDLESFTAALSVALQETLVAPLSPPDPTELELFTWGEVFGRVERVWESVFLTGTR